MSAYDELAGGTFGADAAALFYNATGAVARMNNFPPPDGHARWDDTAVAEVVHEYLSHRPQVKLQRLMLRAVDERSLRLSVQRTMRNHLSDLARETVGGRISRAVRRRLELAESVEALGGAGAGSQWMIEGGDRDASQPPIEHLITAAYSAPRVRQARMPVTPGRGTAVLDPESLENVLLAALGAANSPLSLATLLQVVEARFPLVFHKPEVPLEDDSQPDTDYDLIGVSGEADLVWSQLNLLERLVMPVLAGERTIRDAAEQLGMSRSSIHRAVERVRVVMRATLDNDDTATAVARELLSRASQLANGTPGADSPSSNNGGRQE